MATATSVPSSMKIWLAGTAAVSQTVSEGGTR